MRSSGVLYKQRTQTRSVVQEMVLHHQTSLRAKWAPSTKWDHLKLHQADFVTLVRSWRIASTFSEAMTASSDSTIFTTSFCRSRKILSCHSQPSALTSKAGSQTLKTQTSHFWLKDQKNGKCLLISSSLAAVHTSLPCSKRLLCMTKTNKAGACIKLEKIRYEVLIEVLTYLYTDECQITLNNVMELFETADLFGIERLKFMCE